jgi:hypothetical protein
MVEALLAAGVPPACRSARRTPVATSPARRAPPAPRSSRCRSPAPAPGARRATAWSNCGRPCRRRGACGRAAPGSPAACAQAGRRAHFRIDAASALTESRRHAVPSGAPTRELSSSSARFRRPAGLEPADSCLSSTSVRGFRGVAAAGELTRLAQFVRRAPSNTGFRSRRRVRRPAAERIAFGAPQEGGIDDHRPAGAEQLRAPASSSRCVGAGVRLGRVDAAIGQPSRWPGQRRQAEQALALSTSERRRIRRPASAAPQASSRRAVLAVVLPDPDKAAGDLQASASTRALRAREFRFVRVGSGDPPAPGRGSRARHVEFPGTPSGRRLPGGRAGRRSWRAPRRDTRRRSAAVAMAVEVAATSSQAFSSQAAEARRAVVEQVDPDEGKFADRIVPAEVVVELDAVEGHAPGRRSAPGCPGAGRRGPRGCSRKPACAAAKPARRRRANSVSVQFGKFLDRWLLSGRQQRAAVRQSFRARQAMHLCRRAEAAVGGRSGGAAAWKACRSVASWRQLLRLQFTARQRHGRAARPRRSAACAPPIRWPAVRRQGWEPRAATDRHHVEIEVGSQPAVQQPVRRGSRPRALSRLP